MSSQIITPLPARESMLRRTWESVRPNFAVLFTLLVIALLWIELGTILSPIASWLISFFEPVFSFVGELLVNLGALLVCLSAFALLVLLLAGTIPSSR